MTSSGTEITNAIEAVGSGVAITDEFTIATGESVRVVLTFTIDAGALPVRLFLAESIDPPITLNEISNKVALSAGVNTAILTSEESVTTCVIVIDADNPITFHTSTIHAQLLIGYSEEGTLGLFVHALDLYAFQLTPLVKQVLVKYDPADPTLVKTWNVTMIEPCKKAVYVRYLNSEGYYAFMAFSAFPQRSNQNSKIGSVINTFSDMAAANSRNRNIGYRDSFDRLDVIAASVPIEFRRKLMEIFTSPAVYIWQGKATPDENMLATWSNIGYETFTSDGAVVISAINTAGNGEADAIIGDVEQGETITIIFDFTLNSGAVPFVRIINNAASAVISNSVLSAAGFNKIDLVITVSGENAKLRLLNTAASNFSTGKFIVKHSEVETDWILAEGVEGSHSLRTKKKADNFECTLVLPAKYTQQ